MMANEFYQSSEDTLTKMEFESFDHHAYETVDKYSESYINRHAPQPYLEIEIRSPPAQPTQKANGFTECPLYASASFDNAADGKQTAESSFSQKMSVPGDAARPAVTNEEEERYVINEFEEGGADSTYATVR